LLPTDLDSRVTTASAAITLARTVTSESRNASAGRSDASTFPTALPLVKLRNSAFRDDEVVGSNPAIPTKVKGPDSSTRDRALTWP
jgi:hypothetical protein